MSGETVSLTIRLPKDLHAALTRLAQQEHRSLNGQAVAMLSAATAPKMRAERRAG
jgi:hypothetical protein